MVPMTLVWWDCPTWKASPRSTALDGPEVTSKHERDMYKYFTAWSRTLAMLAASALMRFSRILLADQHRQSGVRYGVPNSRLALCIDEMHNDKLPIGSAS